MGRQRPDGDVDLLRDDRPGWLQGHDRHGHPVGDAALVHFAATLRRHLRPADTIARLGGDEFALILMNCSGDDACLLLERLQQALAGSPLAVPGGAVPLRFSAGVAELHAAESLGQVLERADAALLDAKQLGKAMVRLSVPPTRSAQANACDRQTASASVPIAIAEPGSDG
ncbi:GGDEF domain-containing protein [Accumulibacter sp.]|uniref:GGDEF domain-containing protein n=1 Tax=Accumulibacter sp. TaxID=2053492 RepID=UPI00260EBA1A|nr:GGDEF domain-containing protein [Accumulibacter sp.]